MTALQVRALCSPLLLYAIMAAGCGSDAGPVSNDEADPRWSAGVPLPRPLVGAAAAAYRGAIYVAGGESAGGPSLAVFRFVPGGESWERLGDLPDFRIDGRLVVVDDALYMVGGWAVRPGDNLLLFPAQALWRYHPETDVWVERAPFPDNRNGDAAGVPGKIVVVGGGFGSAEHGGVFPGDSAVLYDAGADRWQYSAPLSEPRSNPMAVAAGARVHVFGGVPVGSSMNVARQIEIYDASTDAWAAGGTFPDYYERIFGQAYARLGDYVHFLGGHGIGPGAPATDIHVRYDLGKQTWEPLPLLPTPRSRAAAVAVDGKLYVIGGLRGPRGIAGAFTDVVEVWSDPQ